MPFTIPNRGTGFHALLSCPDRVDTETLGDIGIPNGVVSGCAVTAQGTPNMTVAVAAGRVIANGTPAGATAGNVTVPTADPTDYRLDLVVVSNTGTKSLIQGTPGTNPTFPARPAGSVVLAGIIVPPGVTAIENAQIVDKRVVVSASGLVVAGPLTADVGPSNSSAETVIISYPIPANLLAVASSFRFRVEGDTDSIITSGNLTWRLRYGGVGGVLLASVVRNSQGSAKTNSPFFWDGDFTVRTIGATGTGIGAFFLRDTFSGLQQSDTTTTPAVIDTTVAKDLALTAQWATADAGNIFRAKLGRIEVVKL